ncbi:MAG: LacI family DNA-binding transcriptional regulator [Clostridiales bacterium]|nr:LacI family DNA-binding transcriptional regulator [Clostridiales bacterium]
MVTIKDLSNICGVSVSTISKALNGQPDVNPETAESIRKIAHDLGYHPNSAARFLKTNRSYNIGVLFADQLKHEYFSLVLDSIREASQASGYDITFISNKIGSSEMSFLKHASYRNCDGVVIAQARFEDPQVVELATSELPTVVIDHVFSECPSIMSENVQSMEEILDYVSGMGHTRIAFIHGEERSAVTQKRLSGFYKACMGLGIKVPEEYILEAKYHSPKESGLATRSLLELREPPTCILYPDDYSYMGGFTEIEKHGLSVPKDISAVGYDGINLAEMFRPRLTTYRQNVEEIGRAAVHSLIAQIENPGEKLREMVIIRGSLLIGDSVRKIDE